MKADIQMPRADTVPPGWSPLNWLRSLGRAASIATGQPAPSHAEYRGFCILTTGQDGAYFARITHHGSRPIAGHIRHPIDTAGFGSREEALQHARFVIASGALNPLLRTGGNPV